MNCLQHVCLISFQSLKREAFYPFVVPPHKIFNVANVSSTVGYDCFLQVTVFQGEVLTLNL